MTIPCIHKVAPNLKEFGVNQLKFIEFSLGNVWLALLYIQMLYRVVPCYNRIFIFFFVDASVIESETEITLK